MSEAFVEGLTKAYGEKTAVDHLRLSKNPCFQEAKAWIFFGRWGNKEKNQAKMEFSQLQFASFFRFMAANLSLTHRVTAAKPLWCV